MNPDDHDEFEAETTKASIAGIFRHVLPEIVAVAAVMTVSAISTALAFVAAFYQPHWLITVGQILFLVGVSPVWFWLAWKRQSAQKASRKTRTAEENARLIAEENAKPAWERYRKPMVFGRLLTWRLPRALMTAPALLAWTPEPVAWSIVAILATVSLSAPALSTKRLAQAALMMSPRPVGGLDTPEI